MTPDAVFAESCVRGGRGESVDHPARFCYVLPGRQGFICIVHGAAEAGQRSPLHSVFIIESRHLHARVGPDLALGRLDLEDVVVEHEFVFQRKLKRTHSDNMLQ